MRVGVERIECNSTGEIALNYFPITVADLDSTEIGNILIVRLRAYNVLARLCAPALRLSNLFAPTK